MSATTRSVDTDTGSEPGIESTDTNAGRSRSLIGDDSGQVDDIGSVILGIGIAVVIGFVVLYIANEVMTMTNVSEGDPLYPAYESLQTATNNTFEMFGLLFLVVVLSVAIVYLWRAQAGR